MRNRRLVLIGTMVSVLSLASMGLAVASPEQQSFRHCEPPAAGEPWPTAAPEEVGLDPVALAQAVTFATMRQSATFQVVRFGCLVASSALDPVFGRVKRNMWSHTKTLVALLVGRAETLGYLGLDDTVGSLFPEADAAHAAITVRHLLTMTSGLHTEYVNELDLLQPDRVRSALALPVDHQPGTQFDYNQTAVTLLAALVERAVGQDLQAFAQTELFEPIGMSRDSWFWLRDRSGNTEGWALWFSEPNDNLARLGALMLHEGSWDGMQLIDERYMRELRTPTETNPGYGYLTWLNAGPWYWTPGFPSRQRREHRPIESAPPDTYLSWGFHGQHVIVVPSLELVITRTHMLHDLGTLDLQPDLRLLGGDAGEGYHELFRLLMHAVTDQAVPDPGPWTEALDYTIHPEYVLDQPLLVLGMLGIGPDAPPGCNVLGCDGVLAVAGPLAAVEDIVATTLGTAPP